MSLRFSALAAALALATGPAMAYPIPADPQPVDGGPKLTWVARPDIWKIDEAATVTDPGVGLAEVECALNEDGRLVRCAVVSEDPRGHKVGAFAMVLAKSWRARLTDAEGGSIDGRRVRFRINLGRSVGL